VLTVDLWDQHGQQEVNLVRHSNSSPAVSISAATTAPYPPPPERPYLGLLNPQQLQAYYASIGDQSTAQNLNQFIPRQMNQPGMNVMYQQSGQPGYGQYPQSPVVTQPNYMQAATIPVPIIPAPTAGMFTRNLIGSLSVNAFKLTDTEGKVGFWFVLQDLSVRTEGLFRYVSTPIPVFFLNSLRCRGCEVGYPSSQQANMALQTQDEFRGRWKPRKQRHAEHRQSPSLGNLLF
jgi:hypothetical protein